MFINLYLPPALSALWSRLQSLTSLKLPLDNFEQGVIFHCPNLFPLANDYGSLGFPLNLAFTTLISRRVSCCSISLSGIASLYLFYFTELIFYHNWKCVFCSFPITLHLFLFCSNGRATCVPFSYGTEPNLSWSFAVCF